MGYPTGFDADIECMSSDEKSDNEGKNETVSSNSSNNTGHSTTETSSTLEVYLIFPFPLKEKKNPCLVCKASALLALLLRQLPFSTFFVHYYYGEL